MNDKTMILVVDDEPRYVRLVQVNLDTQSTPPKTGSKRWKRLRRLSPGYYCWMS
jgi:hypothetical protein